MEIYLRKTAQNTMIPCDQDGHDYIKKLPVGQDVRVKITRARNIKFHRQYFALLNHAFDIFEPEDVEIPQHLSVRGIVPEKNFDRFRKDIAILAGFYHATIRVDGEVRIEADSISFGKMDNDAFADLYSKTIDVILKHVLKNYTREDLDLVVDEILGFA